MKSTFLKIITLFLLLAAPKIFAQSRTTNFFAAPQDSQSPLIIATDASSVCVGVTYVHPETGVIVTGTAAAGNSCLGKQQNQKPTCNADGQRDCVIADDGKFSAVDATSANSNLNPGVIRRGQTIGGVQGSFPSTLWPLNTGKDPSSLDTSGVTKTAPQIFTLFGTDGNPYQFRVRKISDGDFVPLPTSSFFLSAPTSTSPTTLYLPFKVSGNSELSSDDILIPNTVLGVQGTSLPRDTFKAESTGREDVKNSQDEVIAKATVFIDYPTQNRWILMREDTTTVPPPPLARTVAEALALCTVAKVKVGSNTYSSSTGTWALPTSNQVAWMLKTGATGPDGLITKEEIFESKFWVSDIGTYKTAYFPNPISNPVTEPPASSTSTGNVICVFKFATTGTGSGTGTGTGSSGSTPPNPTNLTAFTQAANSVTLGWVTGGVNTAAFWVAYQTGPTAPDTCSAGTAVPATSINLTGATISGLLSGTAYSFRVCATDNGTSPLFSSGRTITATTSGSGGPDR